MCDLGATGVAVSFVVLDTLVLLALPAVPGVDVPSAATSLARTALERM